MIKRTSALTARKNLGQLLEEVYYRGAEIIIERAGKPMAVLISIDEFEQWRKQREKDFSILDKIREAKKGVNPADVEAVVQAAIDDIRKG